MAYVDDFKMFGPCENMSKGWKLIRTSIKTDEPSPPGECLGCNHIIKQVSTNGKKVRQMIYDMEQFMAQCVETYLTAANKTHDSLKHTINTGALQPNCFQRSNESFTRSKNGKI